MTTLSLSIVWILLLALRPPVPPAPCPPLHVRNPAGNYIVPGVKGDIPYSGGLALDAYVQDGGRRRPSVVVIHGGGWTSGSRVAHVGQLLELLTRAGYNWFSLDYRLSGLRGAGESLADIRAALSFIRCRAADLGIDAAQLLLLGEDAGAHLAALLATERPEGVVGAVLIGGFYDLAAVPARAVDLPPAVAARLSPRLRIVPGMPPLLVVHGGADAEAPAAQAKDYCRAVEESGGRCRFLEVPGASHRSENWWPAQWTYKREVTAWLNAAAPARPAGFARGGGELHKDIAYSASPALRLDAYLPRTTDPGPAVVIVHGGGWEAGDKVTYVTPLFEPLARAGLAWFSIDYRLTPEVTHEEQLADLRRAIRFIRAEHRRFGIDPSRIVLLGESAGGQMVTRLAAEDPAVAAVVSFYGVYDFPAMVTDASPRSLLVRLFRRTTLDEDAREVLRKYSPLHSARDGMPPVLLVNGTADILWPQGQAFATRLRELRVPHETIVLDGAPHGLENWEGHPEWTGYKGRVPAWIRGVVR